MTDKRLWSYKDIAAHIRVQPDTVRSYRKHGLLPAPDHVESGKPYWYVDTIRAWVAARPGNRGRRDGPGVPHLLSPAGPDPVFPGPA
ncbi:helix-turn-helix transcriptional regulator, partial [Streptomyces sp. NPDC057101]|uniref:helix-turn-helix transcriptional regulator n=2 Tax=Streptomyces TaxID=1883 RepID=UPI003628FAD1